MNASVRLNGISRSERQPLIRSATEAVQKCGGWVEDLHLFSNLAVNLHCVIVASGAARLGEELMGLRIGLGHHDAAALHRAAASLSPEDELKLSYLRA